MVVENAVPTDAGLLGITKLYHHMRLDLVKKGPFDLGKCFNMLGDLVGKCFNISHATRARGCGKRARGCGDVVGKAGCGKLCELR